MIKIGIYDSGCGGFSVLNHLLNSGFTGEIFYYGDTKNNPWGNKSKKDLAKILTEIADWFKAHDVNTIISGCNTTVGVFKNELTSIFGTNVLNILENTEHHYHASSYSVLLTENSHKNKLFSQFLSNKEIQEVSCPNLANLIEENNTEDAIQIAKTFVNQCIHPNIILGCTHYPLILDELAIHFPSKAFIDPAVFFNLNKHSNKTKPTIKFKTSGNESQFQKVIDNHLPLITYSLNNIHYKKEEKLTIK